MVLQFASQSLPRPVTLSLRPESSNLSLGAERIYSFDGAGRMLSAHRGGALYRRGLDGRVMEKRRDMELAARVRRDLAEDEKRALLAEMRAWLVRVSAALPANAPPEAYARLARLLAWDEDAYARDAAAFRAIYRPVAILPPDQYLALVLQATEGCHYNACTFCDFYRATRFRVKRADEFREHVAQVRAFLGDGLGLRRSIFLADANALVVPQRQLLDFFESLHAQFAIAPAGLSGAALAGWKAAHPAGITGVYSFLDAFSGKKKTQDDFAELAALGLRRIYIGMESGHVPLLDFLRKPSLPEDVCAVVESARAAGVNVGVILMTGIGGERFAAGHIADSLAAVNALNLGDGDLLYFSDFVETPGSQYVSLAREARVRALGGQELRAQQAALRAGLRFAGAAKISTYDIREFVY